MSQGGHTRLNLGDKIKREKLEYIQMLCRHYGSGDSFILAYNVIMHVRYYSQFRVYVKVLLCFVV